MSGPHERILQCSATTTKMNAMLAFAVMALANVYVSRQSLSAHVRQ
jgi:hypothetical protein